MKKSALLVFLSLLLFGTGCENEFDVVDTWKEIPVVYGLLNLNETTQYIRVEKAFLDPATDATIIAQIADSLYFQNISVELDEMDASGSNIETIILDLVDAATEGIPREDGVFASEPNWVFKMEHPLDEEKVYKLNVISSDGSSPITAETRIVDNFDLQTPPSPQQSVTFRLWNQLQPATFQWTIGDNAKFYDLFLNINFKEVTASGTEIKQLTWTLAKSFEPESTTVGKISDINHTLLLEFLAANLDPVANVCRDIIDVDVVVYAGGEDLLNFINVGSANSGITGTVPLNEYTNLSRGFGVFSSRNMIEVEGIKISNVVLNELATSALTSDLGFRETGDPECD